MYGAAYYPHLKTSLTYRYESQQVIVQGLPTIVNLGTRNGIVVQYHDQDENPLVPTVRVIIVDPVPAGERFVIDTDARQLTIQAQSSDNGAAIATAWETFVQEKGEGGAVHGFSVRQNGDGQGRLSATESDIPLQSTLASIQSSHTTLYNQIKSRLNEAWVTLPPSPAVAGIYARVDRDRGVWKAPANVGIASVIEPTRLITHTEQDRLNVHPSGKSINAIRSFTGKGTLVWGARTLAGNDNEWRYISVRRLFITLEESIQKAINFAVFEPNDATTWLKVKAMIESYLYSLWEQGALAGATPEAAYFVSVGLGQTMSTQDVLEGRLIVDVGVAAVRPAEFIILRFSHILQTA
ncbi:hypothetical protein C2W62_35855 [Candidatus Entotheonella serta]|nr:hypothetical protein C2W62_35855 [Candidatus Entotheonella serta]